MATGNSDDDIIKNYQPSLGDETLLGSCLDPVDPFSGHVSGPNLMEGMQYSDILHPNGAQGNYVEMQNVVLSQEDMFNSQGAGSYPDQYQIQGCNIAAVRGTEGGDARRDASMFTPSPAENKSAGSYQYQIQGCNIAAVRGTEGGDAGGDASMFTPSPAENKRDGSDILQLNKSVLNDTSPTIPPMHETPKSSNPNTRNKGRFEPKAKECESEEEKRKREEANEARRIYRRAETLFKGIKELSDVSPGEEWTGFLVLTNKNKTKYIYGGDETMATRFEDHQPITSQKPSPGENASKIDMSKIQKKIEAAAAKKKKEKRKSATATDAVPSSADTSPIQLTPLPNQKSQRAMYSSPTLFLSGANASPASELIAEQNEAAATKKATTKRRLANIYSKTCQGNNKRKTKPSDK